jgi:2-oxoglutarate dehydrogenase E2 component (dihydrolipoamide succinyltransferase)
MSLEMKIPSPGESITEVEIAQWLVESGDYVETDQIIAEIDSDKATLELPAESSGIITLIAEDGEAVAVGQVVCKIDTDAKKPEGFESSASVEKEETTSVKESVESKPVPAVSSQEVNVKATPLAKEVMKQNAVNPSKVNPSGSNGKILRDDVDVYLTGGVDASTIYMPTGQRNENRKQMSMLRRKLSKRLVAVKNETAMLTTFNEVDMKPIMDLRKKYKQAFGEKHGVGLGFMSFFTKACAEALTLYPLVNSMIDGDEVISYDYADIAIAVSAPKGLMVPVIRNAETLGLAEIESEVKRLALKARDGKLSLEEMTGGTFTITNGGVFGSMLSTPIINPPQSAILGMHNIVERPVAINGKVEIRPIMYVALSYDHRIIDGKDSVGFLKTVKEMLENPTKLIFGGKEPVEVLLGL